jgi:hypothetical protein
MRRQRTSQALAGVHVAAYRPVDTTTVDLVVIRDGRFHASARCGRLEAERRASALASSSGPADDSPFLITTERAMLARWLSAGDVVLLSVTGRYAEPIDGGETLHRITTQLRRQRTTGRPADELTSKRLRRPQVTAPAS